MVTSLESAARGRSWRECLSAEVEWYGTAEAIRIADNVLYYHTQHPSHYYLYL